MPEQYSEEAVYRKLDALIKECGSQAEAANRLGITRQYLNIILSKKCGMSMTVAARLGFTKKIVYEGA